MKNSHRILLIVSLFVLPPAGIFIYGFIANSIGGSQETKKYTEITWRDLRELDYRTGQKTPKLESVNGKGIRVPGFIVPLDDDATQASEFLLVPSPQACIHVPPPPPNQMILVTMKEGVPAPKRSYGPVWVKGRFHITTTESQFGKTSYTLHGEESEPYKAIY